MIYLVERTDTVDYEEVQALVVRARSADAAIRMVLRGDHNGVKSQGDLKITSIPSKGPAKVVLLSELGS